MQRKIILPIDAVYNITLLKTFLENNTAWGVKWIDDEIKKVKERHKTKLSKKDIIHLYISIHNEIINNKVTDNNKHKGHVPMSYNYLRKRYDYKVTNTKLLKLFKTIQVISLVGNHDTENKECYHVGIKYHLEHLNYKKQDILNTMDDITTYLKRYGIEISPVTLANKEIKENNKYGLNELFELTCDVTKSDYLYKTPTKTLLNKKYNGSNAIRILGNKHVDKFRLDTDAAYQYIHDSIVKISNKSEFDRYFNNVKNTISFMIWAVKHIEAEASNGTLLFRRSKAHYKGVKGKLIHPSRVYTNLTNLPSDLRQFMVGASEMVMLDITNSQPLFFNKIIESYLKKDKKNVVLKFEYELFKEKTIAGKWYEYMRDEIYKLKPDRQARNQCKKNWMLLAYSKNGNQKRVKAPFNKHFPELNKIIIAGKVTAHREFAVRLQSEESKVFIDSICKKLIKNEIIPFVIHDAIVVNKTECSKAKSIMEECLTKHFGKTPDIDVTDLVPLDANKAFESVWAKRLADYQSKRG